MKVDLEAYTKEELIIFIKRNVNAYSYNPGRVHHQLETIRHELRAGVAR